MAKQTTKHQLLNDIRTERRRLEAALDRLSESDMLQSGVVGAWSVKDVLAHLVAWERLFRDWYASGVQGVAPSDMPVGMEKGAINTLNEQIYACNQDRRLAEVQTEFHASYQETLSVIESITEADMFAQGRFAWTGKYILADYIAGNTCNHYAWAKLQIRKWLKARQPD